MREDVACVMSSLIGWDLAQLVFLWGLWSVCYLLSALLGQHNGCDRVSNHQGGRGVASRLFTEWFVQVQIKENIKALICVTGLCEGNSPVTGEFPSQRVRDVENFSIWWHNHVGSSWAWGGTCSDCGNVHYSSLLYILYIIAKYWGDGGGIWQHIWWH